MINYLYIFIHNTYLYTYIQSSLYEKSHCAVNYEVQKHCC